MNGAKQSPVLTGVSALELQRLSKPSDYGWIAVPLDDFMIKINLWAVYVIGYRVNALSSPGFLTLNGLDTWYYLHEAQKSLEDFADSDPLQFSRGMLDTTKTLSSRVQECLDLFNGDPPIISKSMKFGDPLSKESIAIFHSVNDLAKLFESDLSHECENLSTFFIGRIGTHHTEKLMESAIDNLSEVVRSRLSVDATNDINAAGRCLALNVPTASGFHILRAVEALMRDYHFKLTGTHLAKKNRNWGAFIKVLTENGATSDVTGFLTHIKDHYRNVIIHPEANLSAAEAFSLFNASLSAITMLDATIHSFRVL